MCWANSLLEIVGASPKSSSFFLLLPCVGSLTMETLHLSTLPPSTFLIQSYNQRTLHLNISIPSLLSSQHTPSKLREREIAERRRGKRSCCHFVFPQPSSILFENLAFGAVSGLCGAVRVGFGAARCRFGAVQTASRPVATADGMDVASSSVSRRLMAKAAWLDVEDDGGYSRTAAVVSGVERGGVSDSAGEQRTAAISVGEDSRGGGGESAKQQQQRLSDDCLVPSLHQRFPRKRRRWWCSGMVVK